MTSAAPRRRPVIRLDRVEKTYHLGEIEVRALQGVSFEVERGDFVAIMGASGSGKSTLMNVIGCLDVPSRGRYLLDGVDVRKHDDEDLAIIRNRKIGFVFQSFNLIPRTSARANVELPLIYAGMRKAERGERVQAALEAVGLADRADHLPSELSGGEQQRAAVARAIATDPALILADEPTGNLDSHSTLEVLEIFNRLNAEGRTVLIITHEAEVAAHAKRVVVLRDGLITADRRPAVGSGGRPAAPPVDHRGGAVNFENVRIAIRGISANRLRSALTMLGIMIGVAAVIVLVAVGNGSSKAVQTRLQSLGTNTLTVAAGGFGPRGGGNNSVRPTLTTTDVTAISDPTLVPDISQVAPVKSTSAAAAAGGNSYTPGQVLGTTANMAGIRDYTTTSGSFFTENDVTNHNRVVVLGTTVVKNLFGTTEDPVGQDVKIGNATWTVAGVLKSKGTNGLQDQDDLVLAPITSLEDNITGNNDQVNQIVAQATSRNTTDAASAEITAVLASNHKSTTGQTQFQVLNQASLLATSQSTTQVFTVLLGAVAAISLLVGGIGVMNIMLVTVTERTREIGIRKAIGARRWDILGQFMVEAVLLSVVGGVLGVVFGILGSRFKIVGVQPVIAPGSVLLAFGVALAVGLFFGIYPANRAASLSPIDALRYE